MNRINEKELIENGMTIKKMKKQKIQLSEAMQEALMDAPIHKIADIHEFFGDVFNINNGRITDVITI